MENRFEHNPLEETQPGWGAYVSPPRYTGEEESTEQRTTLCLRIRGYLPEMIENPASVNPELARSILAHLAVCLACAREFEEMKRVVALLNQLPEMESAPDFSGIILKRIQVEIGSQRGAPPRPTFAVSSEGCGEAAKTRADSNTGWLGSASLGTSVRVKTSRSIRNERLSGMAFVSGVAAALLSTSWGSRLFGVNAATIQGLLNQVLASARRIPVLGSIAVLIASVVAQSVAVISDTLRSFGNTTSAVLAFDVLFCVAAYYVFFARSTQYTRRGPC